MPRGSRRLPARCVAELERADLILHAGDFVSLVVLVELEAFAPVVGVVGNMDDADLRAALPLERVVEVGAARIGMVHDAGPARGRAERLVSRFPGCAAVVYGHTHVAEVTQVGGVWILNPGSPTERRRSPGHSLIVVQVDGAELEPALVRV
jgi:putative phosphoesterase